MNYQQKNLNIDLNYIFVVNYIASGVDLFCTHYQGLGNI